jgi:hypothetical protein
MSTSFYTLYRKKVIEAFDYLVLNKDNPIQNIHFDVRHAWKSRSMRGIYLKHADELYETKDYFVNVEPVFFENKRKTSITSEMAASVDDPSLLSGKRETSHCFLFSYILIYDESNISSMHTKRSY